jgi:hypothetical protein
MMMKNQMTTAMKNNFIFICFLLFFSSAFSQNESLEKLYFGPNQVKKLDRSMPKLLFIQDTLRLPIIDDFSKNKIKDFEVNVSDPYVKDSLFHIFRANGQYPDSLYCKKDTVFDLVINTSTNDTTYIAQAPIIVEYFRDSVLFFTPTDTAIFWSSEYIVSDGTTSLIVPIPPDTILYNFKETVWVKFPKPNEYWINQGAYLNNTFAVDPPTIGVITFDGTDEMGTPYDFENPFTFGLADVFTSKPINLELKPNNQPYEIKDSIYLSFFYQAEGNGDYPQPGDSLLLEFYNVDDDTWERKWGEKGGRTEVFKEVYILIDDEKYLKNAFRFRFKNLATLSGAWDHWHIDYVRLDANRALANKEIDDLAFSMPSGSYLKSYTSMPYQHYIASNPSSHMETEKIVYQNNLSLSQKIIENYYFVYEQFSTTQLFVSTVINQPHDLGGVLNVPPQTPFKVRHTVNSAPNNFTFPSDPTVLRKNFVVLNSTKTTPDVNLDNDTIYHLQEFGTYYAYDDGSAERAWSVQPQPNARVAVRFNAFKADTLKAVLINFPMMRDNIANSRMRIMVWKKLEESPIYVSTFVDLFYSPGNTFTRYELDQPLVVEGEFFIGFLQREALKYYIGWDVNSNSSTNIYYNISSEWVNTVFEGSLLMRPDFGDTAPFVGVEQIQLESDFQELVVYPNPAQHTIYVKGDIKEGDSFMYRIFDISGKLITQNTSYSTAIDVHSLKNGFYILSVQKDEYTKPIAKKLIISR